MGEAEKVHFSVAFVLYDMEMQLTLTNLYNFNRSRSFYCDLRSLGFIILRSFLSVDKKLMTITFSYLLITRTGINFQMSSKFGYIAHFPVE